MIEILKFGDFLSVMVAWSMQDVLAKKCSCIQGIVSFGHVLIMIIPSMWIWVNSGYVCRGTNTTPKNARINQNLPFLGLTDQTPGTLGTSQQLVLHGCVFPIQIVRFVIFHFYPSTVMARKLQNSSKTANLASCLTSTDGHPKNDSLNLHCVLKDHISPSNSSHIVHSFDVF